MKNVFTKCLCATALTFVSFASVASIPLAVWDGSNTDLGEFSLTTSNDNSVENGIITIAENATGGVVYTGPDSSLNNCTFIIRCTGLDLASGKNQHLISLHQNNLDEASYNKVGVSMAAISGTDTKSNVRGIWQNVIYNNPNYQVSQSFENGTDIVINFQQSGGVFVYEIVTDSTTGTRSLVTRYENTNLKSSSSNYKGFSIGGIYNNPDNNFDSNLAVAQGWVVTKMAVFGSTLSETEILAYDFSPVNTWNVSNDYSFDSSDNWTQGLPSDGEDIIIRAIEDVTLSVDGSYSPRTVYIEGDGMVSFVGNGSIDADRIEVMGRATYCSTGVIVPGGTPHVVHGTLKTKGDVTLSSPDNTVDPSGVLDVENGTLTFTCDDRTLKGTVYVREGAILAPQTTDAFNYGGSQEMHVYGTLAMGSTRWTTGGNNKIYLYGGASVTGGDNDAGNIDFNASGAGQIVVKRNEKTGDCIVNFSAALRSNNNDDGTIVIDPGVTLVMSGKLINARKITKSGAGHLVFDTPNDSTGGYIWVSEGTVGGKGFVHNITMAPGTVLQPVPGGLSVNGFYVNPNDTDQGILLNSGRINPETLSAGAEFTLLTVTGGNLSIPIGKIDINMGSRYQTAISDDNKTVVATVKPGMPTKFFHYDYIQSNGIAADSRYNCGTYNGNRVAGKRDGAININKNYTPYYSSNSAEKSPFYAGEVSLCALVKIKESDVSNTILWNHGSAFSDGIAVIAKDSSTIALVSWVGGSAGTEIVSVSGIDDLLKKWHLITIVASANGTILYVDGKSSSSERLIPFSISQEGQFGSIYNNAKGYNKFGENGFLLDDWRLYDAALTQKEVKMLKSELYPVPFFIRIR